MFSVCLYYYITAWYQDITYGFILTYDNVIYSYCKLLPFPFYILLNYHLFAFHFKRLFENVSYVNRDYY